MMQNKRKKLLMAVGLIFVVLSYVFGIQYIFDTIRGKEKNEGENGKHYVAVITKSGESDFWKSVYAGASAAGTEHNLKVTFDCPDNEEDYETQNQMIAKAVEDGAEVIVFSAIDYNANVAAVEDAIRSGVRVVIIDSDVNSDKVSSRIGTDNYEAGSMAAEAVLAGKDEQLNVGIVNFDVNTANGQQREQGFRSSTEKDPRVRIIETINVNSTLEAAKEGTISMLERHPDINVLVTFNEWTSLGVSYAVRERELADSTTVVAFDSNTICVGMLETGEVDALIVQNPYAMGYMGVECAYNLIYGFPISGERVDTATSLITRDNMFDENYQKLLFTFTNN